MILGILDYSAVPASERPAPTEAVYLATDGLEAVYARAKRLNCLSPELIHNDPENPSGQIVVRPWGERSFYVDDPAGNALCFVDDRTLFTGSEEQVASLARATSASPRRTR